MQVPRTTITLGIAAQGVLVQSGDPQFLDTPTDPLNVADTQTLSNGSSASQINQTWHNERTLAASAAETLALVGALTDSFGETVNFARLRGVLVLNNSSTGSMTIGGAGTSPWVGWFGGGTQTITLPPGGRLLLESPSDATGWPVTSGSAFNLLMTNNDSANPLTYQIVLLGATT